jgi:glutathione peroxidase
MRNGTSLTLTLGLFVVWLAAVPGCSTDSSEPSGGGQQNTPAAPAPSGSNQNPSKPNLPQEPKEPEQPLVPNACPGKTGELYELNVRKLAQVDETQLCTFRGHVLLVVNGASFCGQTYQYEPLQALYEKYKDQKFDVLAFPSKSFNQESSSDTEVSTFCTDKYKITFPLFTIAPVVDTTTDTAQPVYQWIKKQPGFESPVPWNFEKFIIGKDGKAARRFGYLVNPTMTVATPAGEGGDKITQPHKDKGVVNVVEDAILTELEKP